MVWQALSRAASARPRARRILPRHRHQAQDQQAHDLLKKGQLEKAPGVASVLANALLNGIGVPKNPNQAIVILKKASAAGDG